MEKKRKQEQNNGENTPVGNMVYKEIMHRVSLYDEKQILKYYGPPNTESSTGYLLVLAA